MTSGNEGMNFQIVKPQLTTDEFLDLLVATFPETRDEVLDPDYAGLIHLQVGRLAAYANKCIETRRFDELRRVFDFFEATMRKVTTDVENALYVSFLEHVDFEGFQQKEIRQYLKSELYNAWIQLRR